LLPAKVLSLFAEKASEENIEGKNSLIEKGGDVWR